MKTFSCAVLVSLTLLVPLAIAQEAQTLKERLSDKASDARRVDNCQSSAAEPCLAPIARQSRGTPRRPPKWVRQLTGLSAPPGAQLLSGGASGFSNSARLSIASP
jgi:hypothetical protein